MNKIFIVTSGIIISSFLVACSGGGGNSSSAIEGLDFSGDYTLQNVQCTNSSLTAITNQTTFSGIANENINITGNLYSGSSTYGTCTITFSGRIVLTSSGLTISNRKINSATGGSCTQVLTLNGSAITPTTLNQDYTTNESLSTFTNVPYIWNPNTRVFGLLSIFSDSTPNGYCFITYNKL